MGVELEGCGRRQTPQLPPETALAGLRDFMSSSEIRRRVERFASLQAAHRALCHSVHPSQLESVRGESRALLILLQTYSTQIQAGGQKPALDAAPVSLEDIDRGLFEQSERTLTVLGRINLAQLRATIPALSEQHPEEVCGLIDLLLSGDLDSDKNLRMLEYLITIMSTQDSNGRRVVVREPCQVTPRLDEAAADRLGAATADCLVAEQVLENATAKALQGGDIGETRDRVRRYKEELGRDVLHPRVLAAAVAYNVAMWNEVANEIESSRSIEQLTEDLLVTEAESGLVSALMAPARETLSSKPFTQLIHAFGARVLGQPLGDDPTSLVVGTLDLKALRVEDIELFAENEANGADEATWLMRSAVVLGLVLCKCDALEKPLTDLSLDPELLATQCVDDLASQISELARKRFSESDYSDAFRLSDVKTHSLTPHLATRSSGAADSIGALPVSTPHRSGSSMKLAQMVRDLPPWPVLFAGLLLAAVFAVPTIVTHTAGESNSQSAVAQISPHLVRGRHMGQGEAQLFVGRVGGSWDYLDTEQRRQVVSEIGAHFAAQGIDRVVLEGAQRQIMAEFDDGRIRYLVNRAPGQSIPD